MAPHGIERITMASGDTDWWQAISEKVDWFTPITDKAMSLELLRTDAAKDGPFESPDEYLLAKSIAGDNSDNIPGVPGVGVKTAVKLLRTHGGIDGICSAVQNGSAKDKKSAAIAEQHATIQRNLRIMDWRQAPDSAQWQIGVAREPFHAAAALDWCAELGLGRLSERLSDDGAWAKRVGGWPIGIVMDFLE
jgi:DNA polymerase-1